MELKILIVDDDLPVLNALKRALSFHYDLMDASSGPMALELIDQFGAFHVVVSDLRMQGMDGIQFATEAKRRCPDTYIIMLTGNQDQTALDYVEQSGVVDFVMHKPSTKRDLIEAIEQARIAVEKIAQTKPDTCFGSLHANS